MNSKTILRNTAWYGLENVINYASSLVTSIAIARTLGPSKMGYIIYVTWVVSMTSSLGSVGIPGTTKKYMSEFLGRGDQATARAVYLRTLLLQLLVGTIVTLAVLAWVLHDSPAEYRVAALLLVASTLPAMVNFISAQANVASESLSGNVPASAASAATYFVVTMLSVVMHWGVNGIALAMLLMRLTDFGVRFFPTMGRISRWPRHGASLPPDLNARMRSFALQGLAGMLLTLIVWDRSEIFLLKRLSPDIRQLAFFSVALGLADRLLIFPSIFAAATGASILAQYGRDASKLPAMTAASVRYLALSSIPVHMIATALVGPALLTMYGNRYAGALLVATFSPMLCLPKAFLGPIQSLFESTDQQRYFIYSTIGASFLDLGVAYWLIPSLGALGACIGGSLAQASAIGIMWWIGVRKYQIELPWRFMGKLSLVSLVSSATAYAASFRLPSFAGLVVGGVASVICFLGLSFASRLLEPEDLARLKFLVSLCPKPFVGAAEFLLLMLTRRAARSATV